MQHNTVEIILKTIPNINNKSELTVFGSRKSNIPIIAHAIFKNAKKITSP